MDFVKICKRSAGKNRLEIYPKFVIGNTKDLMIKGKDFLAFWDEDHKQWSTEQSDLIKAIDKLLDKYYEDNKDDILSSGAAYVCHMWDGDSGSVDKWRHFCQKQMHDHFQDLDDNIVFLNDPYERELYSTHRLPYSLEEGPTPNYDKLMSTLYSPEERLKIEWAFGSIIEGDSKYIQKFLVLTGDPGTGKSTVLLILKKLFEGYTEKINSKAIGSGKDFALETVASNPLVAYEDDTDLSKIQDNTQLNSLVSHEELTVNKKFKSQYTQRFRTMIFLCSNGDVNITDSRSGIIRRLIDVSPTGNKLPKREYDKCMKGIDFELGGIAYHCHQIYLNNKNIFDSYIPTRMMRSTNVVFSWLEENYEHIEAKDGITLAMAWSSYKQYCDDCDIQYRLNRLQLRNELRGYFEEFISDGYLDDGTHVRSYFNGFKTEKFDDISVRSKPPEPIDSWLVLDKTNSIFDETYSDLPAQYATQDEVGRPLVSWDKNKSALKDIKSTRLHYILPPKNMIVIDFDIKNEGGGKDYLLNIEEASKWPPTYAELSKSGAGIHLHYIYNGDISKLSSLVKENVEIKLPIGNSSIRRQLTYCNDIPVATISSGLPLRKEERNMVDVMSFKSQKHLIAFIAKQLRKETHADTHSSVSYILKALNDAYNSGLVYSIPIDLREDIMRFAKSSTNQSADCIKMVSMMKWESDVEDKSNYIEDSPDKPIAFFDIEVLPNLLLICWKEIGKSCKWVLNPEPEAVGYLFEKYRLIGFNNRKYDNHILCARYMGYSIFDCYVRSSQIINSHKSRDNDCFLRQAYNISYTDVYDYSTAKQSLKKWEIVLGINHKEMEINWNEPIPEELIPKLIEYCCADVEATEKVFNATAADFKAREILADWAGMTANTTTNQLTTRIIFGGCKDPNSSLRWRDLSKPVKEWTNDAQRRFLQEECGRFTEAFDDRSVIPYFPGYTFVDGKSLYRDFEVGEGGFVYAEPGMYTNVALIDVESMHPNSYIDELYSGVEYTRKFKQILDLRLCLKHNEFDTARHMFEGKLAKYLDDEGSADALSYALKIAINSVYGLTSAKFETAFYNSANKDNIVAKRGALFMIDLLYSVQEAGFTVAHIKTDSIKIPNATTEIIQRVMDIGHKYGYNFEHEATYEKMCLVNNAVYIAKYLDAETCEQMYGYIPSKNRKKSGQWTATGTQFQVPYVFKTLFTHEPIDFDDVCEIKSVTTSIYIDMGSDEEHNYKFVGRVGQFTPVKVGGGILVRKADDKYNSVTGTKGYRWLESSDVKLLGMDFVDQSYYIKMVDDARDAISKYCDFEWFAA